MFNQLKINNYYYDIFIRYTNVSIITIFLLNLLKNKTILNKDIEIETYLRNNLPIYSNIHLDYSILFTRKLHLLVGKPADINNITTFLGTENGFINNNINDSFYMPIDFFLSIDSFLPNTSDINMFKNAYLFTNLNLNNDYMNLFLNDDDDDDDDDTDTYNNSLFSNILDEEDTTSLSINLNYLTPINITKRLIYFIRIKRKYYNFSYNLKKKRLSKLVANLRNKNTFEKVKYHELRLSNIIINTFLISKIDLLNFTKEGYIFLNGKVCNNTDIMVKKGDRIQLCINKDLYLYQRLHYSILIKKYFSTLNYLYKKKQTSSFNKKMFMNLTCNFFDIPEYIEVDFTVMTLFILYIPVNISSYNLYNLHYKNLLKFNLLNWKLLY